MKLSNLSSDIAARTGISRLTQTLLACSILTNVVLAFAVATADRTHRETLVPPQITRSFWVEDTRVSPEYLEEMGLFVLRNALDATPSSAEYQAGVVLKYACPANHGTLQAELAANSKRMKENNVSTFFSITAVTPDPTTSSVAFHGQLATIYASQPLSQQARSFAIRFAMANGRICLVEMRETTAAEPFTPAESSPAR